MRRCYAQRCCREKTNLAEIIASRGFLPTDRAGPTKIQAARLHRFPRFRLSKGHVQAVAALRKSGPTCCPWATACSRATWLENGEAGNSYSLLTTGVSH